MICGCLNRNSKIWIDLEEGHHIDRKSIKLDPGLSRFIPEIAGFLPMDDICLIFSIHSSIYKQSESIWSHFSKIHRIPNRFDLWNLLDQIDLMSKHPIYKDYVKVEDKRHKAIKFMQIMHLVWKKFKSIPPHHLVRMFSMVIECPDLLGFFEILAQNHCKDTIQLLKWSPIDLIQNLRKDKYLSKIEIDENILKRVYMLGIKKSILNLVLVPDLANSENAFELVKKCGVLIYGIPDHIKTKKICLEAAKNGCKLYDIPVVLRDAEIYTIFIRRDGTVLKIVPSDLISRQMCLYAVLQNAEALRFVPKQFLDQEICEFCLENHKLEAEAFGYIPEDMRSFKLCVLAVSRYNCCWDLVPSSLDKCQLEIQVNAIRAQDPSLPLDKRQFR
jgi:hypothetical protein